VLCRRFDAMNVAHESTNVPESPEMGTTGGSAPGFVATMATRDPEQRLACLGVSGCTGPDVAS
jgi:hypothetical protein